VCTDTNNDDDHCGSCTNVCAPNEVCNGAGVCEPACGNGVVDPGEVCDDGNTISGDGCSATCNSTEVCGNGILDLGTGPTNCLVWSTGNTSGTPDIAAWLMASGRFDSVVGINQTNFTLVELLAYDGILFFTNSSSGSDPSNGDVLADYADTGRGLVIATFSWANQGGNTLGGRIITDEISPFVVGGGSLYANVTIDSHDGSIFFSGVTAITGYFHDDVTLTTDAVLRGTWSDGEPLLAQKSNVIGVNLFPVNNNVSGDYQQLFINALSAVTGSEQCDDGNLVDGDGCNSACEYE
jgi:cysteine-rich repeat protein